MESTYCNKSRKAKGASPKVILGPTEHAKVLVFQRAYHHKEIKKR